VQTFLSKNQWRLYRDLTWLWPIISPPEEHIKENEKFSKLLRACSSDEIQTLLNLGCGGGHDDFTLKKYFNITSVDISPAMIDLAKRLNPEVTYKIGDMRTIRIAQVFDAVLISDSIAYMLTKDDLLASFRTAFTHLRPGGVMLTLVEETTESFQQNKTLCSTHIKDKVEVAFVQNYYDPNPKDTTYEVTLLYLIRRRGHQTIEADYHQCGLFSLETWKELLQETGFQVEQKELKAWDVVERVYPLLVGIKPI